MLGQIDQHITERRSKMGVAIRRTRL